MKQLAIYTAGVFGYGGIVVAIVLIIVALRRYLGPYSNAEPFVGASFFFFFVGVVGLLIMFAVGGA